jgi:interferon gamma-inducible protein 30
MALADLSYVPYGNAHIDPTSGAIACQHGQRECDLNAVLGCAVHLGGHQAEWFPFVACVEEGAAQDKGTAALVAECAAAANLSEEEITACAAGGLPLAGAGAGRPWPGCGHRAAPPASAWPLAAPATVRQAPPPDPCAAGDLGQQLQLAAMKQTQKLRPPHQYVPWVVVNGIPLLGDYANLGAFVCVAFQGPK